MPLTIGQTLTNRYRILGLLSQDATSATYQALDLALNRTCAVKELRLDPYATPAAQAQARQSFQREAQRLASATDPSQPRVWDYFTGDGNEYMVMDLAPGVGPAHWETPAVGERTLLLGDVPVAGPSPPIPPARGPLVSRPRGRRLVPLMAVAVGGVALCLIVCLCGGGSLAPTAVSQWELSQWHAEALAAYERGDWEEAIAGFEHIRARDPHYDEAVQYQYDAHVQYGRAFLAAGRLAEAEAQFRQALRVQPDGTEAQAGLAEIQRRRTPPATTTPTPPPMATPTRAPTSTPYRSPTPQPTATPAVSYCYVGRKVKYGDDPAPYGAIRGYVRDRYGQGKSGVRVRFQSDNWSQDTYTGRDGFYSICCLEPHLYDVKLVGLPCRAVLKLEVPRYRWNQVDFVEQECQ